MIVLKAFRFNVCVTGFCYFRKPINTAYLDTYTVPPPTTILGMLSNSLGLARGDYRLQDELRIAVRKNYGEVLEEYAQLLKEPKSYFPDYMYNSQQYEEYIRTKLLNDEMEADKEQLAAVMKKKIKDDGYKVRSRAVEYSSSPMKRRVLVEPDFTIYIASENNCLLEKTQEKLQSPERPLYLGASDSIAYIYDISSIKDIVETDKKLVDTVCIGIHKGGFVTKLPHRFINMNKKINVEYSEVLTIFPSYPNEIESGTQIYQFGDESICLI